MKFGKSKFSVINDMLKVSVKFIHNKDRQINLGIISFEK